MATEQELIDAGARHQVLLERLKSGEIKEAEEDSTLIEEAALALLLGVGFENAKELKKNELNALARAMAQQVGQIHDSYIDEFVSRLQDLAEYETTFEARTLRRILGKDIDPSSKAFRYAFNKPMGTDGTTVRDFLAKWKASEVAAYEDAIRKIWVDGMSMSDAVKALKGTRTLAFGDGLTNKINNWRKTNINTLVQHFAMSAKESTWLDSGGEVAHYRWISILDSRTTNICRSRSRKVYTVGEGPIPPAHRNCRSFVTIIG